MEICARSPSAVCEGGMKELKRCQLGQPWPGPHLRAPEMTHLSCDAGCWARQLLPGGGI